MNEEKKSKKERSYFAAANGFTGFRSYFDNIFNPYEYERIFVLKGGPGTGKSSLMKKLLKFADNNGIPCEAIYCSSDPDSLDGVIIDERVAVIDGTAPHERDAKLPGAIDEITNLGDSWNEEILKSERDNIKAINRNKSDYYNSAYKYLAISGNISDYIFDIIKKLYDFSLSGDFVEKLNFTNSKDECPREKTRLISSFGRCGYKRLDTLQSDAKTVYNVKGIYGSEYLFVENLLTKTKDKHNITKFPSPFSEKMTEAILFEETGTLFLVNADSGDVIDTSLFLNLDLRQREELDFLTLEKEKFLEKSKSCFEKASAEHFNLEKIYTGAMNFSKNDRIYEELNRKILKILEA